MQRGDAAVADEQGDLVGRGPVADEVAEAQGARDSAALDVGEDRLEPGQVAVHVGEDGERLVDLDGLHAACPSARMVLVSGFIMP